MSKETIWTRMERVSAVVASWPPWVKGSPVNVREPDAHWINEETIAYNVLLRAELERGRIAEDEAARGLDAIRGVARHARPDGVLCSYLARGYCNKCGSFPDTDTYNGLKRRFPMNLMMGFLYRHRGGWMQKLPFVGVYFTREYWKK